MKSVRHIFPCGACALLFAALLLALPSLAQAEPNFLGNVPAGTSTHKAIAKIGVRVPTTFDNTGKEFDFTKNTTDYIFQIEGDIEIWRSGPLDNFNDPITGLPVGAAADGLNTLRLEIVSLKNFTVTPPVGANISSIKIGDGVTGGTNSGPFFSTGGAAEIGPNGSLANGFLNLFLEVNVTQPVIPVPGSLQAFPFNLNPTYPINTLTNNVALHLEAVIDEFAPNGISFLLTGGPIGAFAPASNPFVQALDGLPAPLRRVAAPMQFAQFISADLQIVPEPGSIVFGLMAAGAFGTIVWRRRRAAKAA